MARRSTPVGPGRRPHADRNDPRRRPRPTPEEVAAAAGGRVPDVLAPGLDVLFCGINPSLYSAATGHNFARPGNRFWRALHESGLTERLLDPAEERELLRQGLGITNLVARATATAAELSDAELAEGGRRLERRVARLRPKVVAVLGITAFRSAFGRRKARLGRQPEDIGGAALWVLPNPSGLNAHYTPRALARVFREFARAIGRVT